MECFNGRSCSIAHGNLCEPNRVSGTSSRCKAKSKGPVERSQIDRQVKSDKSQHQGSGCNTCWKGENAMKCYEKQGVIGLKSPWQNRENWWKLEGVQSIGRMAFEVLKKWPREDELQLRIWHVGRQRNHLESLGQYQDSYRDSSQVVNGWIKISSFHKHE